MKPPPYESILNKTLFTVPVWLKRGVRVAFGLALILATLFYLYLVWRSVRSYDLVGPATGIPGWLVLFEANAFALLALRSGYLLIVGSKRRTTSGIEFGGMAMLGSTYRFKSSSSEEYAAAFPILFGFGTLMLLFLVGVIVWEWKTGEFVPGTHVAE